MNNQENITPVTLIPVLELDIKTFHPPGHSEEGLFVSKYQKLSKIGNYIESPDGWFIPLTLLREDLAVFSQYLLLETAHIGELTICGGFQIWFGDEYIPSVSPGTSFRFAMQLADWMIKKEREVKQEIFINNDSYLTFYIKGDELTISIPDEQDREIKTALLDFLQQCEYAKRVTVEFAKAMESLIEKSSNCAITSSDVRFQFGLS